LSSLSQPQLQSLNVHVQASPAAQKSHADMFARGEYLPGSQRIGTGDLDEPVKLPAVTAASKPNTQIMNAAFTDHIALVQDEAKITTDCKCSCLAKCPLTY
jgi:hypothetical protein